MIEVEPPDELSWLTELLGAEHTLALIETYGGMLLWVPSFDKPGSDPRVRARLEQQIGTSAAKTLIQYFGGSRIRVPLCKEWRARLYSARGMTQDAIAQRLVTDRRTVWGYLHPSRESQLKLPL